MRRASSLILIVGMALGFATEVHACSIPVFRYALEHWQPDAYQLFVFTHGRPTAEEQLVLDRVMEVQADPTKPQRIRVSLVDLEAALSDDAARLREEHPGEKFPWIVLRQPESDQAPGRVVWSGPLHSPIITGLLSSPLRTKISEQLIEGESVVWVLLESGDPARDERAWKTLTGELTRLQEKLELPAIDPADAAELTVLPESLKLAFSAHRLSRDAVEERALVEMLLSTEPDLRDAELSGQPMAFPIFGRGRVLYALIGEGIGAGTIEEACRFLTAGCQCTVKQENPGIDLLFEVDWAKYIEPTVPLKTTLPPLVGLQSFAEEADGGAGDGGFPHGAETGEQPMPARETVDSSREAAPAGANDSGHLDATPADVVNWFGSTLLALGGLAIVVTVATLFVLLHRR